MGMFDVLSLIFLIFIRITYVYKVTGTLGFAMYVGMIDFMLIIFIIGVFGGIADNLAISV